MKSLTLKDKLSYLENGLVINKDYQILEGKLNFTKNHFTEDCDIII